MAIIKEEQYGGAAITNNAQMATTSGACGANATWSYNTATQSLIISGTGRMYDYYDGNFPLWFSYMQTCTTTVVQNGITHIGDHAFGGFDGVYSVSLPESLLDIGQMAFAGTERLKSISFPFSLQVISDQAFQAEGLTSI